MARNTSGRGWAYRSVEHCHCGGLAAKWSVYSYRMVCNSCLSLERAAYELAEAQKAAQAAQDAATLEGVQAEYRDATDTERSLREGLHW